MNQHLDAAIKPNHNLIRGTEQFVPLYISCTSYISKYIERCNFINIHRYGSFILQSILHNDKLGITVASAILFGLMISVDGGGNMETKENQENQPHISPFEAIRRVNEQNNQEFWSARLNLPNS